ncbi:ArsR/SmtB family transcription factor [Demequina muriae]|uniref:Metalloregulator ArsR/SmtB family transcription factor n=1 Tax=Demequina muriae TaxID=3051664 RepID=A0ABT8GD21_9MICO|nr:metalloregulator ArsR/SmtB family transcription factor [Demequina sp. EGI L300058]MDN4479323.1 metalloregulator ArsR/SmtB family transcription factor [Demequina sp. EGI L300058]
MAVSIGIETGLARSTERVALLEAVSDAVRWTVLDVLSHGPQCVCDLQARVPVPGNLLSYHLKVLREAGLVTASRRGRWVDYAIASDALTRLADALPGVHRTGEP